MVATTLNEIAISIVKITVLALRRKLLQLPNYYFYLVGGFRHIPVVCKRIVRFIWWLQAFMRFLRKRLRRRWFYSLARLLLLPYPSRNKNVSPRCRAPIKHLSSAFPRNEIHKKIAKLLLFTWNHLLFRDVVRVCDNFCACNEIAETSFRYLCKQASVTDWDEHRKNGARQTEDYLTNPSLEVRRTLESN